MTLERQHGAVERVPMTGNQGPGFQPWWHRSTDMALNNSFTTLRPQFTYLSNRGLQPIVSMASNMGGSSEFKLRLQRMEGVGVAMTLKRIFSHIV